MPRPERDASRNVSLLRRPGNQNDDAKLASLGERVQLISILGRLRTVIHHRGHAHLKNTRPPAPCIAGGWWVTLAFRRGGLAGLRKW